MACSGKMYNMTDNLIMDVFNHIVCAFIYIYNVLDIYGQGALVCEEKSRHIVIPFKLA